MADQRCGTCFHWTKSKDNWIGRIRGECAILKFTGLLDDECKTDAAMTPCPGWTSRFELDRLYAAVADLPDDLRERLIELCRNGPGACFCGSHVSEVQE